MSHLHLTDSELNQVQQILKKHVSEFVIWAFGSRVTGKAKKFSDLDLVIMTNDVFDIKKLFALKNDFSESNLPFKVDIVIWSDLDKDFKKIIENKYYVLQS